MVESYEQYLKNLPTIPDVAARILNITEDRLDVSFRELERIIKVDPGLTARILQIANSALYARPKEISSLQSAIALLGFKSIKSMVLLVLASTVFRKMEHTALYSFFWRHSLISAFLARDLAVRCARRESAEEAFLGGLLHDIGQLALFQADPDAYERILARVRSGADSVCSLEKERFGVDHREVGARALEKWNFPDLYVDASREHERLSIDSHHRSLVMIVSAASLVASGLEEVRLGAEKEAMLRELFSRLELGAADLEYYRSTFFEDMRRDPLFRECQGLFGLQEPAGPAAG